LKVSRVVIEKLLCEARVLEMESFFRHSVAGWFI
jgi:hypothetical protein